MAKVYVSSTFLDLEECRKKVNLVLRRMGHEDVAMEYYVAEDKRPFDKCLEDVASCDLYVGIFAWRYGWVPKKNNPKKLSITEAEYRQAFEYNKTCLIFLLDGKAPWPPDFIDDDKARIKRLRDELAEEHGGGRFHSAEELGRIVAESIHKWEKEKGFIIPKGLHPEFDLAAYFTALKKRYQRLDLDALTPPQKEEYLQLQLQNIFVEQSVRENPPPIELSKGAWERLQYEWDKLQPSQSRLLDYAPAALTLDDLRRMREIYYEKTLRPVLDVISEPRHRQIVILGDPGAGKSTLARYVMLSLIDPLGDIKLRTSLNGHLPLLIELRTYWSLHADGKCDTFLEFLEYLGKTEGWHLNQIELHNHLKINGLAIVIFDGLDEIFDPEDRELITRRIVGFTNDYPKVRIIVTSRVIGYRRNILAGAGFAHFTLQDLDEQQVEIFINRWYGLVLSDRPDEAVERRDRILNSLKESTSIRQLSSNPMLLTILAIIAKHQELPRERWKLYDHAASVLIEHWDVNKHLKEQSLEVDFIGEDEKKALLQRLAYVIQDGTGGLAGNYIHRLKLQSEFEDYLKRRYNMASDRVALTARAMINQFRERDFILCHQGDSFYGFVHRAFLEFFCATAFVHKFEKAQEMTFDELAEQAYGTHEEDPNWHEVLRLICGIVDEKFAGQIIDYLRRKSQPQPEKPYGSLPWNIALAIRCLGEVKNLRALSEPAKRLLQFLCLLFENRLAGNKLLNADNSRDSDFIRDEIAAAAKVVGKNWPHRRVLVNWVRSLRSFANAREHYWAFGIFIGSVGEGLNEVHQAILRYATHEDDNRRILAPITLAKGWHSNEETIPLLCDMAVNDKNSEVRHAAISALIEDYSDAPQTLSLLCDRVVEDNNSGVCYTAASALVDYFRGDSRTLPLLQSFARNYQSAPAQPENILIEDKDLEVSFQNPPSGIWKFWKSLQRKSYGRDYQLPRDQTVVEEAYLKAIDSYLRDEVRAAIIELVVRYWPSHPTTLPLLRKLAKKDPNPRVREKAECLVSKLEFNE